MNNIKVTIAEQVLSLIGVHDVGDTVLNAELDSIVIVHPQVSEHWEG